MLDHDQPPQRLLAKARDHYAGSVVGGSYSSGVLAGGKHFEYRQASAAMLDNVAHIQAVARQYQVEPDG